VAFTGQVLTPDDFVAAWTAAIGLTFWIAMQVIVRFRGKSGHFWHQSGHQVRQVANCGFMSAFGGKADMALAAQNVRL
jgi:hypothetical protein